MKHERILEDRGIDPAEFFVTLRNKVLAKGVKSGNSNVTWYTLFVKNEFYNLKISYIENHILGTTTLVVAKRDHSTYKDTVTLVKRLNGLNVFYLQDYTKVYFQSIIDYYGEIEHDPSRY